MLWLSDKLYNNKLNASNNNTSGSNKHVEHKKENSYKIDDLINHYDADTCCNDFFQYISNKSNDY